MDKLGSIERHGIPTQSLEQYLRESLKGFSGGIDSAYWEHLKTDAHNTGTHAFVELQLRQKERAGQLAGSEEFTIYGLKECPPESQVADLIKRHYELQGYSLNEEETTGRDNLVFQRLNGGKKIYVMVTTSPGETGATVIVTSATI